MTLDFVVVGVSAKRWINGNVARSLAATSNTYRKNIVYFRLPVRHVAYPSPLRTTRGVLKNSSPSDGANSGAREGPYRTF